MPDPGYGPNGERLDPGSPTSWQSNAPPIPFTPGWDRWLVYPLGVTFIPTIDQNDDEGWKSVYPGG